VNKSVPPSAARKGMIGQSKTSTIKAAKNLNLPKSVYRVSNIDACYGTVELQEYIESLGVRVVSCFERTSTKEPVFTDNKSFRVCILDVDKSILLCENNWFVGISIQKWKFKPKTDSTDGASHEARPMSIGNTGEETSHSSNTMCSNAVASLLV